MGNYATTAQLKARFEDDSAVAHLTDTWDSGTPDETVLTEVLTHAEGDMDAHFAVRYVVPIDTSGSTTLAGKLQSVALDIAVRHVLTRHGKVPEAFEAAYDDAIEWLKEVVAGTAVLPTADLLAKKTSRRLVWGPTTDSSTQPDSTSRRLFTRETQENL